MHGKGLIFKQRPDKKESGCLVDIEGKKTPGRGNSQCKGPEAGVGLEWSARARWIVQLELSGHEEGRGGEVRSRRASGQATISMQLY